MIFKLFMAIGFVLTSNHIIKLVDKLGYFRYYHKHHPGTCRTIPGVLHGSEDFSLTSERDVFITTGLTWRFNSPTYTEYAKKNKIDGGILLFKFSKPEQGVTRLTLKANSLFDPSQFKPHGIDLIEDKVKGEHSLFVVSHPPNMSDRVEKFRYLPKTKELEHIKTYTDEKFTSLNDLAVTGPDSFYVTNMCKGTNRITSMVEMLALIAWGSLLHRTDDGLVRESVPGLFQPNGITLSKDTRSLYVSVADTLHLYTRHTNGSLELTQELQVQTQLDNIRYNADGSKLLIGCHPKVHKFVEYDENPEYAISPSQVLSIPLKTGRYDEDGVVELFYDHGHLISGSSVATIVNDKLLIGTVQGKLALCDLHA